MNPLLMEILPLVHKGYCCSQLLMHIFLQSVGEENPQLVRSMQGLCIGMGGQEGPCGLLPAGACILSLIAGRGHDDDSAHPSLMPMVQEYHTWFVMHTKSQGQCAELLTSFQAQRQEAINQSNGGGHSLCGQLLADCWEEICTILESYQIDMELKN